MNRLLFHPEVNTKFDRSVWGYFIGYYSYIHHEEGNRLIAYLVLSFPCKSVMLRYQLEYGHYMASREVHERYYSEFSSTSLESV